MTRVTRVTWVTGITRVTRVTWVTGITRTTRVTRVTLGDWDNNYNTNWDN